MAFNLLLGLTLFDFGWERGLGVFRKAKGGQKGLRVREGVDWGIGAFNVGGWPRGEVGRM